MTRIVCGLTVLATVAPAAPAGAATIRVDCSSRHNLQSKINAAPAGSTLLVKGRCTGTFTIAKRLTLDGSPGATLDGNGGGSVLTISGPPRVRLLDLRIEDGNAARGGGIAAQMGPLALIRVTVRGNVAEDEGGGIATDGPLELVRSEISGNRVENAGSSATARGGGIHAGGTLTLTRSVVRGNRAEAEAAANPATAEGGGIYAERGLLASDARIYGNTAHATGPSATAAGGGIATPTVNALVRLVDTILSQNEARGESILASGIAGGGGVSSAGLRVTRGELQLNDAIASSPSGAATAFGGSAAVYRNGMLKGANVNQSVASANGASSATGAGGAIHLVSSEGRLTVTGSRIAGNTVTTTAGTLGATAHGGGIVAQGPVTVTGTWLAANVARATSAQSDAVAFGGGIDAAHSLVLQRSSVTGNVARGTTQDDLAAGIGGGVSLQSTDAPNRIVNSTLAGNAARGFASAGPGPIVVAAGGGVHAGGGVLTLTSTTVARNTVSGEGGAAPSARGGGLAADSASVTLHGSLVARNTASDGPDCQGTVASAGSNLLGTTNGCAFGALDTDRRNLDPRLGTLRHRKGPPTINLRAGSPALNAIPRSRCPSTRDQRRVRRPRERRCEIGAFEREARS